MIVWKGRWVVYSHSIAGEIFYIGRGDSGRPFATKARGPKWEEIVDANGGVFECEILEWFEIEADAIAKEAELIHEISPRGNALKPRILVAAEGDSEDRITYKNLLTHYGGARNAASALGVTPQAVYLWGAKKIPRWAEKKIQHMTRGKLRADK